jgi:hypothetical protein
MWFYEEGFTMNRPFDGIVPATYVLGLLHAKNRWYKMAENEESD